MRTYTFSVLLSTALLSSNSVIAEDAKPEQCSVIDRNGMVLVLLCDADMSAEALAREGAAACNNDRPCGAWIWTNEEFLPSFVPDRHDLLESSAITTSVGVWVDELGQLVTVEAEQK